MPAHIGAGPLGPEPGYLIYIHTLIHKHVQFGKTLRSGVYCDIILALSWVNRTAAQAPVTPRVLPCTNVNQTLHWYMFLYLPWVSHYDRSIKREILLALTQLDFPSHLVYCCVETSWCYGLPIKSTAGGLLLVASSQWHSISPHRGWSAVMRRRERRKEKEEDQGQEQCSSVWAIPMPKVTTRWSIWSSTTALGLLVATIPLNVKPRTTQQLLLPPKSWKGCWSPFFFFFFLNIRYNKRGKVHGHQ